MVLYGEFVDAVSNGDVDWVADWLESLERPEDINEVDTDIGKSFEELRLEDYELGREAGKWWIGGTLQINNDRDMATALDVLQLGLPSDSDEETIPGMRSIEARLRVNNAGALVAMDVV